jgi:hypothetical protein
MWSQNRLHHLNMMWKRIENLVTFQAFEDNLFFRTKLLLTRQPLHTRNWQICTLKLWRNTRPTHLMWPLQAATSFLISKNTSREERSRTVNAEGWFAAKPKAFFLNGLKKLEQQSQVCGAKGGICKYIFFNPMACLSTLRLRVKCKLSSWFLTVRPTGLQYLPTMPPPYSSHNTATAVLIGYYIVTINLLCLHISCKQSEE